MIQGALTLCSQRMAYFKGDDYFVPISDDALSSSETSEDDSTEVNGPLTYTKWRNSHFDEIAELFTILQAAGSAIFSRAFLQNPNARSEFSHFLFRHTII